MELEKLLEVVLDKILEVTRFERGFILLLDERGRPTERMRRTRSRDTATFDRVESEFSGSIVRRVAQTAEAVVVTDIADDAALREQKSVISLGLRSVMCAPMRRQGRVTGIVYVDSRRLADEDRVGDLALLEALASQAAIAVENARLVAEEQRKTELMAILAHEIRNPLAGILGFSELLPDEKLEMAPRFVNLINRIHTDAQRLHRIVDNVLELARVEAGKVEWSMSPVVAGDLLRDVSAAYVGLAGKKKIELKVECDPDTPLALANADRLFQVLSNLIGNALKFTPGGGTVTLAARPETMTAVLGEAGVAPTAKDDLTAWVPLTPGAGEDRTFVRIDVRDTGPGIPPERRERLFEKFAQGEEGKKVSRGVGLGLFISREIVLRHGGMIWVESELGKGSCFSLRIPAAS
jgi:signal transduction histidine kinase